MLKSNINKSKAGENVCVQGGAGGRNPDFAAAENPEHAPTTSQNHISKSRLSGENVRFTFHRWGVQKTIHGRPFRAANGPVEIVMSKVSASLGSLFWGSSKPPGPATVNERPVPEPHQGVRDLLFLLVLFHPANWDHAPHGDCELLCAKRCSCGLEPVYNAAAASL